jgi:Uma2 family endonuclease
MRAALSAAVTHTIAMPHGAVSGSRRGPFTWDDFVRLGEDDLRELIDGELVEVEVPTKWHEHVVAMLVTFLNAWAIPRKAGRALASGYKVRIDETRGVMPDVQFLTAAGFARAGQEGLDDGRPELAVEVLSPSSRGADRVKKLGWYASIGTPEYWIVDPQARTVERLVLSAEGHYTIADGASDAEVFRPASFEGLEVPLAELWDVPASWREE